MYDSDQGFIDHSTQPGLIIIKTNENQNNSNDNNGDNNGPGNPPPINVDPIAIIQVSTDFGIIETNIMFNGSKSYDQDGDELSFFWDFKDGSTSNKKITTHSYKNIGYFNVTLTVEDQKGGSDTINNTIKILPLENHPPQKLNISFESKYLTQKKPMVLKITAEEYDVNDKIKYIINWGDGTTNISEKKLEYIQ